MLKYSHHTLMAIALFFTSATVLTENQSHKTSGIQDFHLQHREDVYKIALAHIISLVPWYAFKWDRPGVPEEACEDQVMCFFDTPNLNQGQHYSKVFINDGVPKGFINYRFKTPWYRALLNQQDGAVVEVHHIAVDNELRGQGIGTQLINHVLEDCKKHSASKVELWSTFKNERFYDKAGFNRTHTTKLGEVKFIQRLRPYPLLEGALYVLKRFHR